MGNTPSNQQNGQASSQRQARKNGNAAKVPNSNNNRLKPPPSPGLAPPALSVPSKKASLDLPDFSALMMTAQTPSIAIPIPGPASHPFYPTDPPPELHHGDSDDDEDVGEHDDEDDDSDGDEEEEDDEESDFGFKSFVVKSTLPPAVVQNTEKESKPIEVRITWSGRGKKVFLARAGDNAWKGRRAMTRTSLSAPFTTVVSLASGTHHYRFLVDDQWCIADDLPKAVDDQGSMANYVSVGLGGAVVGATAVSSSPVTKKSPRLSNARNSLDHRLSSPQSHSFWQNADDDFMLWQGGGWTNEIPLDLIEAALEEQAYLTAPTRTSSRSRHVPRPQVPAAPTLPGHLSKLILNSKPPNPALLAQPTPPSSPPPSELTHDNASKNKKIDTTIVPDDPSVLAVPSHVVLHHLGTSSVRHGVLAVGSTSRYKDKYNTTIYYKPTD